ncbi:integrase [Flammeovirgaceae bacterium 311]|nr:integrase [Flammeovirgaceae bacterium 311]
MISAKITFYLDTRRQKVSGVYPVKLRVYFQAQTKYFPTTLDLTQEEFDGALIANPRKAHQGYRNIMDGIMEKAKGARDGLPFFTFERFEDKLYTSAPPKDDIPTYYEAYIQKLEEEDRIGSADNYRLSLKSIKEFNIILANGYKPERLHFINITPEWLNKYERWMLGKGRSATTVGIYLRPLRAMFNLALADGLITHEYYPFGKRKYQIPAGRNIKKALSKADLKALATFEVEKGSFQDKARDFWFLSFQCNGMNIKDILLLRYKDVHGDKIIFTRAKTQRATKSNQKPIVVNLTDSIKAIIAKWSQQKITGNTFIFPILNDDMDAREQMDASKNFTRFINQHLKKLAKDAGLSNDITTYWARHSFTTIIMRSGASIEMASGLLGHQSTNTTRNYWAGFEDEAVKEVTKNLMNFD